MAAPLRVPAFCKVNLFLEITGKRRDGYHTLSTLFQTVSLADELTLKPAATLSLSCSNPELPTDARNLVYRAASELKEQLKESRGVHIHLKKLVPTGAGLGGGSSDAGTILKSLPRWWRRQPPAGMLHRIGSRLGADVPFFLKGGTASASGIGDRLRALPRLPKIWLVLVFPGFGVSTREAYARARVPLTGRRTIHKMIPLLSRANPKDWVDQLFNRFEEFVFPAYPKLPRLKQQLLDAGALGALMSGSGSTVFGVAENVAQGRRIYAAMKKKYPQTWLVHTV